MAKLFYSVNAIANEFTGWSRKQNQQPVQVWHEEAEDIMKRLLDAPNCSSVHKSLAAHVGLFEYPIQQTRGLFICSFVSDHASRPRFSSRPLD